MQDELDVTSILTPGVQRRHGTLVRSEVAFSVSPFLYQSVSPSAACENHKNNQE